MLNIKTIFDAAVSQHDKILNTPETETEKEILRTTSASLPENVPEFAHIITGIRRCGKSTLIKQDIKQKHKNAFYLNFDDTAVYGFETSDFAVLDMAITQYQTIQKKPDKHLYFDEIQIIPGWETYIKTKLEQGYLVTVTGSNASMLSKELGTRLTGRHLDYELFPFSFEEYCRIKKIKSSSNAAENYVAAGGFPEFLRYGERQILTRLFDDVLIRDVVVRYGINDLKSLQTLALYLATNVGNLVSGTKLSAQLKLKTPATVLDYLSYFEQSYLFSFVPRYDYSARSRSRNPKKIYCIDSGLAKAVTLSYTEDTGRLLENAVWTHLRRSTKNIWYWSTPAYECDFLFGRKEVPEKAVQVCYDLTVENMEREVNGLIEACKTFSLEPLIVTMNQSDTVNAGGMLIPVVPAKKFLYEYNVF